MRRTDLGLALLALLAITGNVLALPRHMVLAGKTRLVKTEITRQKDVEYGIAEGESLKLDLFLPAAQTAGRTRPGIIFIHGGGWSGGDKSEFDDKAEEMAQRGYVAITVNYRLSPKHHFPAALQNVQLAVRWLRSHSDKYHLDPERIASMGASAGGHLASFLGVHDTWDPVATADAPGSRVNCVVDYYGRMDLTLPQGGHDYRPDFTGMPGTATDSVVAYRKASPIIYVDSHTVPFLIVQGARDPQVAPEQSQHMLAALDKAHIEASLLLLAGQGHGFQGAADRLAWDAAKAFLDSHLAAKR